MKNKNVHRISLVALLCCFMLQGCQPTARWQAEREWLAIAGIRDAQGVLKIGFIDPMGQWAIAPEINRPIPFGRDWLRCKRMESGAISI